MNDFKEVGSGSSDSLDIAYEQAMKLPDEEREDTLDMIVTQGLRATVKDQIAIATLNPLQHHESSYPVTHRRQFGPYCGLEALSKTLQAVGVSIDADTVIQQGREMGFSDGTPLSSLGSVVKKLGLEDQVTAEIWPRLMLSLMKSKVQASFGKQMQPPETEQSDDDMQRVLEWIEFLDQENAIVLNVEGDKFLRIPEKYRWERPSLHGIALTGYHVDAQGGLSFSIYDSRLKEGPIDVGSKHLVDNAKALYLKVKKNTAA